MMNLPQRIFLKNNLKSYITLKQKLYNSMRIANFLIEHIEKCQNILSLLRSVRQLCHVVAKCKCGFASDVVRMVEPRESGLTSSHTYIKLQPQ